MAIEKRNYRNPCHELIRYTAVVLQDGKVKFLDLTGTAINKSKNGLCFITRYPLRTGLVLEFKNQLVDCSHGVVVWIRNLGGCYMAGTRLFPKDSLEYRI
ncbi:MAG: hypothetical protein HZB33_11400 [Nitrospirae bacterium]|nr:hypothetical protein [Nitrospirota bacterium]